MTPNNPMTEGEALAVEAFQNAMEAEHGYRPQVFATGVLMNSRDADRYEGWKLALTAHTAASGGEVAGWQRRYRTEGMEWSRWHGWEPDGREDPFPKTSGRWSNEFRPVYTAPPATVPADALLALQNDIMEIVGRCDDVGQLGNEMIGLANRIAALIPKGADHGQR